MNKKILGGASALAVGVIGAGVYLASPGTHVASAAAATPDGSAATAHPAKAGRHPARRLRRAPGVHGQATVRTRNGFVQVDWQRGTLTATGGGTLSVRSADGTTWQWKTDGSTRVRKNGRRADVGALASGDFVVVVGRDGGSGARTARWVIVPKRVPAKATSSPAPSAS